MRGQHINKGWFVKPSLKHSAMAIKWKKALEQQLVFGLMHPVEDRICIKLAWARAGMVP